MLKRLFPYFSVALLFASCSTDVDLNDDWKDITIVYGVVDKSDDYHFIKINKAFLGDGNLYDYAMIRDSSEYPSGSVNAYLEELNSGGVVVNSYLLRDTTFSDRDTNGVFYNPNQTVFYFKKSGLNTSNTYKLIVKLFEGTSKEKEVNGQTVLLDGLSIVNMTSISVGNYDGSSSNYPSPNVKFAPPSNSNKFDLVWRIKWDEYDLAGVPTRKTYDWFIKTLDRSYLNSSGQIEYGVNGIAFYQMIARVILPDPNVSKRIMRAIDIVVYAGDVDLSTYIEINQPQSGLVQERPEYTNISNGYGLFASRVHETLANRHLGLGSYRELAHGPITGGLLFCTDTTNTVYTLASPPTVICP